MEDIEKRIESVPVNTSAERDKQVLDDVLNALEQSRKGQPASFGPAVWRIIMKKKRYKARRGGVCHYGACRRNSA
jgi:hypothetical protein